MITHNLERGYHRNAHFPTFGIIPLVERDLTEAVVQIEIV